MAPAQQNVEVCTETVDSQIKMRLIPSDFKLQNGVTGYENNNSVLNDSASEKLKSDTDFDITKYEDIKFKPQIKWPDLTVQVSLHLTTIYGLYLILTNQVMILTNLFGKLLFFYAFLHEKLILPL